MPLETFEMAPAPLRAFVFIGLVAALLVGLLGVFAYFAYAGQASRVEVMPDGLRLRTAFYGRTLSAAALRTAEARVVDLAAEPSLAPVVRTNGLGLPGFLSGWFRLRDGRRALVCVTDRSRVVVVPTTEGYVLLFSAARPAALLRALEDLNRDAPLAVGP